MSNQNKGADRQSCPRAEWLIALFWVERAKVPDEWPIEAALEQRAFRQACELMRDVVTDIPCTVPGANTADGHKLAAWQATHTGMLWIRRSS